MSTAAGRALTSALDGQIGPYGLTIAFQVMPEMDPEAYAELKADIKANGIHVPVAYDQNDRVVDGHHRLRIADELGLDSDEVPFVEVHISDPAAGRDMAYRMNSHRRHLSRDQKREALERSLRADPHLSNRQHAERVGVSHPTVAAVRRDLQESGEVESFTTRTGRDGVEQPASKPTAADVREAATPQPTSPPSRAKQSADEAIERYPDLAAFADNSDRVLATAAALDGYDDTERSVRLDALAKHAAAERRRQANPTAEETEALGVRREIEAAHRAAERIVSDFRSHVITVVSGSRLGEKGLVTRAMVDELRAAIDLLEGEL